MITTSRDELTLEEKQRLHGLKYYNNYNIDWRTGKEVEDPPETDPTVRCFAVSCPLCCCRPLRPQICLTFCPRLANV